MKIFVILILLLSLPATAEEKKAADEEHVQLVEVFLKTPVAELPAASVDEFLSIDPDTLPKKLQDKYKGKRLELYTLKRVTEGKRKGVLRTPEPDCTAPKDTKAESAVIFKMGGYEELFDEDLICVEKETHCTPHDLMCEYTLQYFVVQKGGKKHNRYFMSSSDVMMGVVAGCRGQAGVGRQTNFFGSMKPLCQH